MEREILGLVHRFENGTLTRRQLVQGLVLLAGQTTGPAAPFRPVGIEHVQIAVKDLARSREFYQKLFGAPLRAAQTQTQVQLQVGSSGDYLSITTDPDRTRPIDHFAIAIEGFSPDSVVTTLNRVVPEAKTEKADAYVYVTDPDGVRLQLVPKQ